MFFGYYGLKAILLTLKQRSCIGLVVSLSTSIKAILLTLKQRSCIGLVVSLDTKALYGNNRMQKVRCSAISLSCWIMVVIVGKPSTKTP